MTKNYVYLNGKFLPEEEAKISVFSGGVLYGEGLFETMRADKGQVFRLEEHLARLKKGAKILGLKVPKDLEKSRQIIRQLVKINHLPDAYLRLMLIPDEKKGASLVFLCRDINLYRKRRNFWTCVIVQSVRQNEYSPLSKLKTLNYLPLLLARKEAESKGADEGILLNSKGEICEGTRTNIFVVTEDGILKTPAVESGCLPGITRKAVIELVKSDAVVQSNSVTLNPSLVILSRRRRISLRTGFVEGLKKLEVREKRIKIEELKRAKEVFLTNSLIGVMPARFAESRRVTKITQQIIGNCRPGSWTKEIQQKYEILVRKETGKLPYRC